MERPSSDSHVDQSLEEQDMKNMIKRFVKDESGATAIEYGLIAAGISIVIVGVTQLVGQRLIAVFTAVAAALQVAAR
jgi:pilus assembly protein Flp/PilA